MSNFKSIVLTFAMFCGGTTAFAVAHDLHPEHTLWFNQQAKDWRTQALHLGNGYMGVSFYGGVETECFDIAEKTFWTGGPNVNSDYNYGIIPGGKDHIDEIRQLVLADQVQKADSVARQHFLGDNKGYGCFSKVGALYLDFSLLSKTVKNYRRGLDVSKSLGFVDYSVEDINYTREYFCSYPDHMFVVHVSADQPGAVSFRLRPEWQYSAEQPVMVKPGEWLVRGLIDKSGLKYCVRIRLDHEGGNLSATSHTLGVEKADAATLYLTVETEYKPVPPSYKGNNPEQQTLRSMANVADMNYKEVKQRHVEDYTSLYDRVALHLAGDTQLSKLPTDQRVRQLQEGMTDDSELKTLWFNLGRYSIISASRKGTLPSNLQGVWNHLENAPWNANYQSNINLQEMYWSCGPTNLPECQASYIDWVKTLLVPGRKVAQAYYGTEGWVCHATSNIWGYTSPGQDLMWGIYPVASAWHCRHLWDQFAFTDDRHYLEETAYPIMREAALFYLQNIQRIDEGLCLIPGVTAEHGIELDANGKSVEYTLQSSESDYRKEYLDPCYQDIEMIYDLFDNLEKAQRIIGKKDDLIAKIHKAKEELVPLKIGRYGQLQEWLKDVDNPRDHHRHISHLYALYPGDMITANSTPELFAAAKKSLDMRGDGVYKSRWPNSGGNFSSAWRMACRARLFEGERAIQIFNEMIREVGFENMMSSQSGNFQVDAMMATPGIFAEMLLQSHDGELHFLPALPAEWPEGEVSGLIARGGYRISLKWKYGQLVSAEIVVPKGKSVPNLRCAGEKLSKKDSRVSIHD